MIRYIQDDTISQFVVTGELEKPQEVLFGVQQVVPLSPFLLDKPAKVLLLDL